MTTSIIELGNDILDLIDYDEDYTDWSRELAEDLLERYEITRKPEPWPTTVGSFVELEWGGHRAFAILIKDDSTAGELMWKFDHSLTDGTSPLLWWGRQAHRMDSAKLIRVIHTAAE